MYLAKWGLHWAEVQGAGSPNSSISTRLFSLLGSDGMKNGWWQPAWTFAFLFYLYICTVTAHQCHGFTSSIDSPKFCHSRSILYFLVTWNSRNPFHDLDKQLALHGPRELAVSRASAVSSREIQVGHAGGVGTSPRALPDRIRCPGAELCQVQNLLPTAVQVQHRERWFSLLHNASISSLSEW